MTLNRVSCDSNAASCDLSRDSRYDAIVMYMPLMIS